MLRVTGITRSRLPSRRGWVASLALLLAGIATVAPFPVRGGDTDVPEPTPSGGNPLYVEPASYDFGANPKLLRRIRSGPHGYLRFVNVPFSQEVCRRLEPMVAGVPNVNLHGDAHLEQYAVTELGRGLTDFDDSSTGPCLVDLMRFGVSVRLACRARGWVEREEELYRHFLRGYRASLDDPAIEAPEPSLVTTIRAGFQDLSPKYFEWVASIMDPISAEERAELDRALGPYTDAMLEENPQIPEGYFRVEKVGALRMGIGSALDLKYLLQVRGPTDDPMDDVVLELKQVRDLGGIPCVTGSGNLDPFRVLLGQARISYTPFRLLGYVRLRGVNFWIHAWVYNYQELSLEMFQTPEQLAEVVYDVGVQLGRGHPKQLADPFGAQLRRELRRAIDRLEPQLLRHSAELEDQTIEAWQRFSDEAPAP